MRKKSKKSKRSERSERSENHERSSDDVQQHKRNAGSYVIIALSIISVGMLASVLVRIYTLQAEQKKKADEIRPQNEENASKSAKENASTVLPPKADPVLDHLNPGKEDPPPDRGLQEVS